MMRHEEQQAKWEAEHIQPYALPQMDARDPSSSVELFLEFVREKDLRHQNGIEMGCGKGRNCTWLASQGDVEKMTGFDFSQTAIRIARERAKDLDLAYKTEFVEMDATREWGFASDSFDIGIDCNASTDIEDAKGRAFAIAEMRRVLKPGGCLLVYAMSVDDEYHRDMIALSPAEEAHAFYHPKTGKFEKVFDEDELAGMYADFALLGARRIEKVAEFFGKQYASSLFWRVYQK